MVRRAFAAVLLALAAIVVGAAALVAPVGASPSQNGASIAVTVRASSQAGTSEGIPRSALSVATVYQYGDFIRDIPESRNSDGVHDLWTATGAGGGRFGPPSYAYDSPRAARAAAIDPGIAWGPFTQVAAGGSGVDSPDAVTADAATTPMSFTSTPSGTGQRIYRAVEPDELADLMGSGQYRNIPGIGDGKYFFPTRQQADAFAEMMTKRGMGGPYCTTSGCIPADVLRQVERISPAGEGAAYYIPDSLLPYIDDILIHGG